ncbi:hypothetical protein Dgeo_1705 [Deinococcus geothermalis DSM 11300]|uniref:Uncharacterized protein n=1 Tax=Deinococcus geothermalis (strain DSM 11300 / CIP 105573 / AG-3a) TaxID=319795 RepID=Q1IXN4_DEIGD|nr:hypothetical protein Dgeo_1705 [Deinococcus geothermalis DSM 11300]
MERRADVRRKGELAGSAGRIRERRQLGGLRPGAQRSGACLAHLRPGKGQQVGGGEGLSGEARRVGVQKGPEGCVPDRRAQGVQGQGAALVGAEVKGVALELER